MMADTKRLGMERAVMRMRELVGGVLGWRQMYPASLAPRPRPAELVRVTMLRRVLRWP